MSVKEDKAVISAAISSELHNAVKRIAAERGITVSKCVGEILGSYALAELEVISIEGVEATISGFLGALQSIRRDGGDLEPRGRQHD